MPRKRNAFISCEICKYRSTRTNSEKRKFMARFPRDEVRCKQWVKAVGKEDLVYVPIEKLHTLKYVCGSHFEDKAFNKKKTRLKKSAIPSKHLKAVLPDEMLLEFPCYINSDTAGYESQKISCVDEVELVKAIAEPKSDVSSWLRMWAKKIKYLCSNR